MPLDSTTAITIDGIQCWDEGTRESFGLTESFAVRTLVCAWNDSPALINFFRGGASQVGGVLEIFIPVAYPRAPWLYVQKVETEGIPVDGLTDENNGYGELVGYKYARLKVTYRNFDYNIAENGSFTVDFASESVKPSRTISTMMWPGDSNRPCPPADALPIRVGVGSFVRTLKNQPAIPMGVITANAGMINSASFLGGDVGTVLFEGASATRRMSAAGAEVFDLTYRFSWRSVGWNTIYNATTNTFLPVLGINSGTPPFQSTDLSVLFFDSSTVLLPSVP